jgi:hypothetical protein
MRGSSVCGRKRRVRAKIVTPETQQAKMVVTYEKYRKNDPGTVICVR